MSRYHRQTPTREWERLRQAAFAQHGRRCARCFGAGRLEVHHRKPLERGGTNDVGNLEVVCRSCHIHHHKPVLSPMKAAWRTLLERTSATP